MSRLPVATIRTTVLVTLVMTISATTMALTWPIAKHMGATKAQSLQAQAKKHPNEAIANLTLAAQFDPANKSIHFDLATALAKKGQNQTALFHVKQAAPSMQRTTLEQQILLELNQARNAVNLIGSDLRPTNIVLNAATYALAGQTRKLDNPPFTQTDSEASQAVDRIKAGRLALAQELYALGLPESAQRIGRTQPVSYEREMLLARISIEKGGAEDLSTAIGQLSTALAEKPSSIPARELLKRAYQLQSRPDKADQQTKYIAELRAK